MLASTSRQSLCLPSGHANKNRIPQGFRRRCWRRPSGKAFAFHLVTPTRTGFPRASGKAFAFRLVTPTRTGFPRASGDDVGVDLPAKPLPSVWSRQQAQNFPGLPAPMLASTFRQSLCLPSGHANKKRLCRCRFVLYVKSPDVRESLKGCSLEYCGKPGSII